MDLENSWQKIVSFNNFFFVENVIYYNLNSLPESEVLGGSVVVWPDAAIMADTNINQFSIFFSFFENAHIFLPAAFKLQFS